MMKTQLKRPLLWFLLLPLLLAFIPQGVHAATEVRAIYFHGNVRCSTCLMFEDWAHTAVERFPEALAKGRLKWQLINFDKPENKHFINDYGLADKALVMVRLEHGKQVRWKNVEEFWDYGDNQKQEFVDFVQTLIADDLKPESVSLLPANSASH